MNRFFRDMQTSLLLIVGLILSCFVSMNVLAMENNVRNKLDKKNRIEYKFNKEIDANLLYAGQWYEFDSPEESEEFYLSEEELGQIFDKLTKITNKSDNGILFTKGYHSFVGTGVFSVCTYVVHNAMEEIRHDFVWGRGITKEEAKRGDKVAIVSTALNPYLKQKDDRKYISINATDYEVVGIYENQDVLENCYRMDMCIFYSSMDELTKKAYFKDQESNIFVQYSSNADNNDNNKKIYGEMREILKSYGLHEEEDIIEQENDDSLISAKLKMNKFFLYITFGFSLLNCVVISDIWIKRRYKEFVIKRTFGFDMWDIIVNLLKDLLLYCSMATMIAFVAQILYSYVTGKNSIRIEYMVDNMISIAGCMVIIILITVAIPIIRIRRITPATQIRINKN